MEKRNLVFLRLAILSFLLISLCKESYSQWGAQQLLSNTSQSLNSISYFNSQVLIAVGSSGALVRTSDAGVNWVTTYINQSVEFTGISCLHNGHAWAVGTSGSIIKTTDYGLTWSNQNSSVTTRLNSVCAINDSIAIAVGANGMIVKTSNGGTTWNIFSTNLTGTIRTVHFTDPSFGFFAGGDFEPAGFVYKTTNGGTTWNPVFNPMTLLTAIQVVSHNTIIGVGIRGMMYSSSDGGTTWNSVYTETGHWLYALHFFNDNEGFIVGGNVNEAFTSYTSNGLSWSPVAFNSSQWLYGCAFPDSNSGYLTGYAGQIYKLKRDKITITSPTGGENWEIGSSQNILWNSADVINVKLEYSTNEGVNWVLIVDSIPSNIGSYSWTVPKTPSKMCKIRISSIEDPSIYKISRSTFRIVGPEINVNYNTPTIWYDTDLDGKESKAIEPIISISSGIISSYVWSLNGKELGVTKNILPEVPTGTWYLLLTLTTDDGIVEKDSLKISVYGSKVKTNGTIESAVSQLNDNIYFVTSTGGGVYEFDTTGVIKWMIQTGGSIQSTVCVSSQDNIYVGSNDTRLYSFDYQGLPRWDKAIGGTIVSSPSVSDSLIYLGITTGRFFALDEAGNFKWSVQTGGAINSSASISESGIIFVGSDDANLYAISQFGSVLWKYTSGGAIRTSPALGLDSSVVFGSDDGFLYKIDLNGNLKWKFQTNGQVKSSPIIGKNGDIYFGSSDGKVYCLSKDGEKLWEFFTGSQVLGTPAFGGDGSVYFGNLNGTVYAIDKEGNLEWMLETGNMIVAPILVTNSKMIMIGDLIGNVYIMRIPPKITTVNSNSKNELTNRIFSGESFEWGTFKGNNQRTGNRKSVATSVRNQRNEIPEKFTLEQNFPNPFNPSTIIRYALPFESNVKLVVYNLLGEVVKELVNGSVATGYQEISFDATNISSGIYFYTLHATSLDGKQNYQSVKKMLLLK
ncbi:MAG: PQQ-binding-like beta-propeller repeat protein [Ignavibacteriaceae bacterium]|nr:PQQ-binding-like beta-propeller repeat protein [Ignavibacteriaceae bacterium]